MPYVFSVPNGPKMLRKTKGGVPPRMRRYVPPLSRPRLISGVTRDNTGAPLGNCTVRLLDTVKDTILEVVISDADGAFTFSALLDDSANYLVAYKNDTPVRGTSDNTLVGV